MSSTRFTFLYQAMQALIFLATLKYSKFIEAIGLLGLSNFYEQHVSSMFNQTILDVNAVKAIVNLLLAYSIISLLINGTFYIVYMKLVRSNKLFACIRVEELVRELLMVAMRILILGSSIIFMAPSINLLLIEFAGTDGDILEVLTGKLTATMIAIVMTISFSVVAINVAQKSIFKTSYEKA